MGNGESSTQSKSATLDVALERRDYFAGDVVRGYVQLEVRRAIQCYGLFVDLMCEAETRLDAADGQEAQRQVVDALSPVSLQVAPGSRYQIAPGKYQIPFEFNLPSAAPPTIELKTISQIYAKTTFIVGVRFRAARGSHDRIRRYRIRVFNRPKENLKPFTVQNRRVFSSFCCFPKGYLECTLMFNRTAFTSGEEIKAHFQIVNNSDFTVRKLEMYSTVTFEVSANGRLVEASQNSPMYEGHVLINPSNGTSGTIAMPFHYIYPSVEVQTIKIFHHVAVRVYATPRKYLEIFVPILAYGYHRDTFAPLEKISKRESKQLLATRQATVNIEDLPEEQPEAEFISSRSLRMATRGRQDSSRSDMSNVRADDNIFGQEIHLATPGPSPDLPRASRRESFPEITDGVVYAEPIDFIPDATVIETSSKQFTLDTPGKC